MANLTHPKPGPVIFKPEQCPSTIINSLRSNSTDLEFGFKSYRLRYVVSEHIKINSSFIYSLIRKCKAWLPGTILTSIDSWWGNLYPGAHVVWETQMFINKKKQKSLNPVVEYNTIGLPNIKWRMQVNKHISEITFSQTIKICLLVRGHSEQRWIAFAKWTHTRTHAHTLSKVLCFTENSSPGHGWELRIVTEMKMRTWRTRFLYVSGKWLFGVD